MYPNLPDVFGRDFIVDFFLPALFERNLHAPVLFGVQNDSRLTAAGGWRGEGWRIRGRRSETYAGKSFRGGSRGGGKWKRG